MNTLTTLPVLRYGSGHRKRWFKNPIHPGSHGAGFDGHIFILSIWTMLNPKSRLGFLQDR